jgi:hypothetical protein
MKKTRAILMIISIIAALGAVTSFVPIHQASAAPFTSDGQFGGPKVGNGLGGLHSNANPNNNGQLNAFHNTPTNQPCSQNCRFHFQNGIPG